MIGINDGNEYVIDINIFWFESNCFRDEICFIEKVKGMWKVVENGERGSWIWGDLIKGVVSR